MQVKARHQALQKHGYGRCVAMTFHHVNDIVLRCKRLKVSDLLVPSADVKVVQNVRVPEEVPRLCAPERGHGNAKETTLLPPPGQLGQRAC